MQFQVEVTRTPDFQRKKQAIQLALCTVLTHEEAAGAVKSWEQLVAASPSLFSGLNLFARKVCERYGKAGRHNELVLAMSRALMSGGADAELTGDAESSGVRPEQEGASTADIPGPEIRTPEFACFQSLLLVMLHKVGEFDPQLGRSAREFLLHVIDNLPWSPEQQDQLIKLINTGETRQTRPYRAGQLKALMHHFVLWMKDMLGDDTLRIVSGEAVAVVEHGHAGKNYPPGEFFS